MPEVRSTDVVREQAKRAHNFIDRLFAELHDIEDQSETSVRNTLDMICSTITKEDAARLCKFIFRLEGLCEQTILGLRRAHKLRFDVVNHTDDEFDRLKAELEKHGV